MFYFYFIPQTPIVESRSIPSSNIRPEAKSMKAQAVIFELSAFAVSATAAAVHVAPAAHAVQGQAVDAHALLNEAMRNGRHCALVTELSHEEAGERMQKLFGEAAHHVFSVIVTGADFHAGGPSAPFDVVLRMLEIEPEDVLVVAGSGRAREAARAAHLNVAARAVHLDVAGAPPKPGRPSRPVLSVPRRRVTDRVDRAVPA
jgi:FMN phosphatase YigB (HAD superfamily)